MNPALFWVFVQNPIDIKTHWINETSCFALLKFCRLLYAPTAMGAFVGISNPLRLTIDILRGWCWTELKSWFVIIRDTSSNKHNQHRIICKNFLYAGIIYDLSEMTTKAKGKQCITKYIYNKTLCFIAVFCWNYSAYVYILFCQKSNLNNTLTKVVSFILKLSIS